MALAVHELALATVLSAVGVRWSLLLVAALIGAGRERRRVVTSTTSPRVALIIPAFREEAVVVPTLRRALASVYPDLEVVLVDDGSPDRTAERADEVAATDARLRVLRLPQNVGKSRALNAAIESVDAEIVVTVDADTWVAPDLVRRLVDVMVARDADAVASNVRVGNRVTGWLREHIYRTDRLLVEYLRQRP